MSSWPQNIAITVVMYVIHVTTMLWSERNDNKIDNKIELQIELLK